MSGSKLRVGSGGCAKIGLTKKQIEIAQDLFYENYEGKQKKPSLPDSAYLIKDRNPILMIHIIEANYEKNAVKYPQFLYGLGVGIPSDENGNDVAIYQVNLVELANWMDPSEGMDE